MPKQDYVAQMFADIDAQRAARTMQNPAAQRSLAVPGPYASPAAVGAPMARGLDSSSPDANTPLGVVPGGPVPLSQMPGFERQPIKNANVQFSPTKFQGIENTGGPVNVNDLQVLPNDSTLDVGQLGQLLSNRLAQLRRMEPGEPHLGWDGVSTDIQHKAGTPNAYLSPEQIAWLSQLGLTTVSSLAPAPPEAYPGSREVTVQDLAGGVADRAMYNMTGKRK